MDRFTSFKLLERIAEVLERSSPRQVEVVLTEGPAVGGTEVVLAVVADVEWVHMPLFLMDSGPMDLLFALEASKDSEEESGSGSKDGDATME
jgi:hypothetical protein